MENADEWTERANRSHCPACDAAHLIAGPWGGSSRNVYCANCMRGWNMHGALYRVVLRVDDIGPIDEERLTWATRQYPDEQPWHLMAQSLPSII